MRKGGRREEWELRWRGTESGQRVKGARREGRRVDPLSWEPWLFEQLMEDGGPVLAAPTASSAVLLTGRAELVVVLGPQPWTDGRRLLSKGC